MNNETYAARIQRKLMKKQYLVEVATGRRKADLVLKNASYVNVFSNELCHGDIAVAKGHRPCSSRARTVVVVRSASDCFVMSRCRSAMAAIWGRWGVICCCSSCASSACRWTSASIAIAA